MGTYFSSPQNEGGINEGGIDENIENKEITTWNGARSYGDIHHPLVALFFKSVRGMACTDYQAVQPKKKTVPPKKIENLNKSLEEYFDEAWETDAENALKFVFYLRDCRMNKKGIDSIGGKGEKQLFRALIRHLRETGRGEHILANLQHIPFYGSWKDILMCFVGTEFEEVALELMAKQLKQDIGSERPSLCAKYAPSEGGAFDRQYGLAGKLAKHLHTSLTGYRKNYLVPLRKRLNIVEQAMCAKQWETINYETVPSIAGKNYKKAFRRNDETRYSKYLESVTKGEKKMNTSVLMPYQMVTPYLNSNSLDATIEAQWVSFLNDRRSRNITFDILPLIDVSGSMFNGATPQPGEVALSLGITVASLNTSGFHNRFITFHETPQLLSMPEGTLYDQVNYIKNTPWGGSTSFLKVFTLILDQMKNNPAETIPKILLVLSDMQFNQTEHNKTNWEVIEQMYQESGYERPFMIFWNLNGTTVDYPIPDATVPNCILLSGYNDNILTSILNGTVPSPLDLVYKTLQSDRYDRIHLQS